MKKLSLIVLVTLLAAACSKTDVTLNIPTLPMISAKVDGNPYSCAFCYSGSSSGGINQANFTINGQDQIRLFWDEPLKPGTYTLSKSIYSVSMMYEKVVDQTYTYLYPSPGTLTITKVDTSQTGALKTLQATFSFKTDTVSGKHYTITDGIINFNH